MSLSNAREAKSSHVSNQVLEEKSAPFNSYSILFQGGVPFRRYELPNWIFQGELANIEWRKTNSCPAVQVLAVKRNINSLGETRSIVCTEHITRTLAEISHLTIPEAIYTLQEMLAMYSSFFSKFGFAVVADNCCGYDYRGEFIGWLGEDLSVSSTNERILKLQSAIVRKAIQTVFNKCEAKKHPLFHDIHSVKCSFDETMKFLEKAPIYYKLNIVQRVALTSLPPNQKFNQSVSSKGIPRISPKYNQTTLSNARMSENEKSETRIFQPSNTEIEMGRPHIQSGYDNPVRTSICASVLPMQKSFITHTQKYLANQGTHERGINKATKIKFSYQLSNSLENKIPLSPKKLPKEIGKKPGFMEYLQEPVVSSFSTNNRQCYSEEDATTRKLQFRHPSKQPSIKDVISAHQKRVETKKLRNRLCSKQFDEFYYPNRKDLGIIEELSSSLQTDEDLVDSLFNSKANSPAREEANARNMSQENSKDFIGNNKESKMTKAHTDYLQSNFGSCIKTTSILLKDVALTIPGKDRLLGITRGTFGKVEEAGRGDSKSCEKEQPKEDKNEDKEGRKAINCKSADHQFEAQLGLNQKSEEKKQGQNWLQALGIRPAQWNQIEKLIANDDNLKESVHCGPDLRSEPIMLQMLERFGREIKESSITY